MKKILIVLVLFVANQSFAQDWREGKTFSEATITEDFCIQLDSESEVSEWYVMDINHLSFADQDEANKAFWTRANNLVSFNVILSENKAYARIHLDRTETPQDVSWWNAYLESVYCSE